MSSRTAQLIGFTFACIAFGALSGEARQDGYKVQLAAYRSHATASAGWDHLRRAHPNVLASLQVAIEKVNLGPKRGIFYRLRVGAFPTASEAEALCNQLRSLGQDCFVVPPSKDTEIILRVEELQRDVDEKFVTLEEKLDTIDQTLQESATVTRDSGVPSYQYDSSPDDGTVDTSSPPGEQYPAEPTPVGDNRPETRPEPLRGLVEGILGFTFETESGAVGAGAIGFNVTPRLQIYGEFGYMRNVLPRSEQDVWDAVVADIPGAAIDSSAPFFYGLGGVRFTITTGSAQPYVVAGAGFAVGRQERTILLDGQDFTRDFRIVNEDFVRTSDQTGPLVSVGGGVDIRFGKNITLDLGYRYQRLFVEGIFFEDDPLDVSRVQFGLGYVF